MGFGNLLVIFLLMYYTYFFFNLISQTKREQLQSKNIKMNTLRSKPVKTLEEQKEFLELKYPKKPKYSFKWIDVLRVFVYIFIGIVVFTVYSKLFDLLELDIPLFIAVLIVILVPLFVNYFLSKLNLQTNDLSVYVKGRKP